MKNATECTMCDGCRHQNSREGNDWCYLFRDAPEQIPCGQHDKFRDTVKPVSVLIGKNPMIGLVLGGFLK